MDLNSGKIYRLEEHDMSEDDARKAGLVPIPAAQEEAVRAMNRHERRAWAAKARKGPGR